MAPGRVLALAHQARYACRRSGACCTAGWHIPVEPDRLPLLRRTFGAVLEPGSQVLRRAADGSCVLFQRAADGLARCSLQHTCGHAALPSACRHFPRIYLHDAFATRLTLSHYCPTVASLLFDTGDLRIVSAPAELAPSGDREGLDALGALPPLLRPGMLMDWESYAAWESGAVSLLARPLPPSLALDGVAFSAEVLRGWRPADGPLAPAVDKAIGVAAGRLPDQLGQGRLRSAAAGSATFWYELALSCLGEGLEHAGTPDELADADSRFVAPFWNLFSEPLRRYLAGRLFGSWMAYQGQGLRTVVDSLRCALGVVRVEAARACAAAAGALSRALLMDAIRQADLLLVHKADGQELARRLAQGESSPVPGRTLASNG